MMIKWAYILLGDNNTGKTTFQKDILAYISGAVYQNLPRNQEYDVTLRAGSSNTKKCFVMNRSIQEQNCTVQNFFTTFIASDACILSSHLVVQDVVTMIEELKKRFYNVGGIFFENSITTNRAMNENIALLDWDERYFVENPVSDDGWEHSIRKGALEFCFHLLNKI